MASGEGSLLKQTLMSQSECFVYKVPPLATASGYRASDWDLASPLETCGFQVERRNNDLYLLFTLENHTKLFALSKIEGEKNSINNLNVETVMDSSRYFVCKILQSNDATKKARTALLGFGFREREIAIDLLGNLQQFRQSIDRELEAKDLASKTKAIPTLAEGEKMHISLPGTKGKTGVVKSPRLVATKGGTPLLLKKPPPGADESSSSIEVPPSPMSPFTDGKRFSLSAMECPMTSMTLKIGPKSEAIDETVPLGGDGDGDDDSAAAQAHTVVDDLMSVEDDLEDEDDDAEGESGGVVDDQSEGAVGGATINDDDTSNDSFQFSELNLDDLDETDNKTEEDAAAAAKKETSDDEDFGDFQEA